MTNIEKKGYQPVVVRIYNKDRQQVLEDEVLCACDIKTNKIVDMGRGARKYTEDNGIAVENPMKWGAVADFLVFSKIMQLYVKKLNLRTIRKPSFVVCVPAKLTAVETTAFIDAFANFGMRFIGSGLFEASFQQVILEKRIEEKKQPDFYIEFVSDYYESEYFG